MSDNNFNSWSKEERTAWNQAIEGFEANAGLSMLVNKYSIGTDAEAERGDDVIWRKVKSPIKPIRRVVGDAITPKKYHQLFVPTVVDQQWYIPLKMTALELRDATNESTLYDSSVVGLNSVIETSVADTLSRYGTIAVTASGAAGDYDDVSKAKIALDEIGVPKENRHIAFNSRDYGGIAKDLTAATRDMGNSKFDNAYKKGEVPKEIAGFMAHTVDSLGTVSAAAGGVTNMDTRKAAGNYYVPKVDDIAAGGYRGKVDNRWQVVTVDNTAGVAEGDSFSVAGVTRYHMVHKRSVGQPMTHRVERILSATTMLITPPIISNQGGSEIEEQEQNCVVVESASAALTWINANATQHNVFWHQSAIELLPSNYVVTDGAGVQYLQHKLKSGLTLLMSKKSENNLTTEYTFDIRYGVALLNPMMAGVLWFNQ